MPHASRQSTYSILALACESYSWPSSTRLRLHSRQYWARFSFIGGRPITKIDGQPLSAFPGPVTTCFYEGYCAGMASRPSTTTAP